MKTLLLILLFQFGASSILRAQSAIKLTLKVTCSNDFEGLWGEYRLIQCDISNRSELDQNINIKNMTVLDNEGNPLQEVLRREKVESILDEMRNKGRARSSNLAWKIVEIALVVVVTVAIVVVASGGRGGGGFNPWLSVPNPYHRKSFTAEETSVHQEFSTKYTIADYLLGQDFTLTGGQTASKFALIPNLSEYTLYKFKVCFEDDLCEVYD